MGLVRSIALALLLFGALAASTSAQSTPTPDDPQQIVDKFEMARGAADVDGALAELSDTAVITVQNETSTRSFTGSVQLRSYLQSVGTRFQTIMRSRPLVQGGSVSWTERDQVDGRAIDATVVATVSSGRIVSLTYRDTGSANAPGRLAAMNTRTEPAQLPNAAWAGGLAVIGLALVALVFARPRRKASHSQLDGRLLLALQKRERQHDFDQHEKRAA